MVEPIQRIMVRAEVFRQGLPSNNSIEHPAKRYPINNAAVTGESHDATRELIHHDENPVCSQCGRFASEQVETPKTVFHVTEESEP